MPSSRSNDAYLEETLEGFHTHELCEGLTWAVQTVLYYAYDFNRPVPDRIHLLTEQVAREIGTLVFGRNFEMIREWRSGLSRVHADTKDDVIFLLFNILSTVLPWKEMPAMLPRTKLGNPQDPRNIRKRVETASKNVFGCEAWQLRQKVYDGLLDRLGALMGIRKLTQQEKRRVEWARTRAIVTESAKVSRPPSLGPSEIPATPSDLRV